MSPWWFIIGSILVCVLAHLGWQWRQIRRVPLLESSFYIECDADDIVCHYPDGTENRVAWSDLQKVEILTTDEGPFLPDVFWVLHGSQSSCIFPQGASGDDVLLERFQRLAGFDNEAFMSMGSTSNASFVCWEAQSKAGS